MNRAPRFIIVLSVAILGVFLMNAVKKTDVSNDSGLNDPKKNTSETYQIKALKIPDNLNFAGE
jgi:hypothetical protein